ncbi:VOC family protein [Amycolatopsis sp. NPDC059657]|uniref:VOC family protein n=1 Tax=Amycolatopsis sp. NPDC059657 TaxID=3346899 RepID=UPI00366F6B11
MTSKLHALCFAATDPARLARFWAELLDWTPQEDYTLLPTDDTGFRLRFLPAEAPKTRQNQMHFDLTSTSLEDQRRTVAKALDLGARHIDIGQLPEEEHVVLADPDGNEFCVIEPGNGFLADCGFVGALACDGSQEVGYFWSKALGWPLVWDQDQETAIRSPHGGPKITWGGPPFAPKTGKNRLHFELTGDPHEIDRLVSLGAAVTDTGLIDPDGNEFTLG